MHKSPSHYSPQADTNPSVFIYVWSRSLTSWSPSLGMALTPPHSSLRPMNPTPQHAQGQGSPQTLRPKNPTPGHAATGHADRPGNKNTLLKWLGESVVKMDDWMGGRWECVYINDNFLSATLLECFLSVCVCVCVRVGLCVLFSLYKILILCMSDYLTYMYITHY